MTHSLPGNQLQCLLDAAGKVMEAAYEDQRAATAAIRSLDEKCNALEQTRKRIESGVGALANHIKNVTDQHAERAASEAARLLSEKFATADIAANAATKRYQEAARWIGLKMGGAAVMAMIVVLFVAWSIARLTLPSQAEIDSLQTTKMQLETEVAQLRQQAADLERKGARIELSTCKAQDGSTHLCVRTNEENYKEVFGDTYRIPAGY